MGRYCIEYVPRNFLPIAQDRLERPLPLLNPVSVKWFNDRTVDSVLGLTTLFFTVPSGATVSTSLTFMQ